MDDTYQGVLRVALAAPHVVIRQCAVLGSVCALFALAVPAHAQDRSVVVERRDGDVTIARNGDVRMVETWAVRFIGGPFHFAYRAIPLNRVESIDGWAVAENGQAYGKGPNSAGERYFVVDNRGNQSMITWYFPPTTDQARTFTLSYTLHGALRISSGGDQFFWKFVESDRAYPINAARVIVHLPAAFPADQIRATTYLNGQEDVSGARRINAETVSFQGGPFAPGQEWEIRTQFPHGAVTASAPAWQVREQRQRVFNLAPEGLQVLALDVSAFPVGAVITHRHVDRTGAAVAKENLFAGRDSAIQGQLYQQWRFRGSVFESARLPPFQGVPRQVWLLATLFPSRPGAVAAYTSDARRPTCSSRPVLALPLRATTCAYITPKGPESGMYVVATAGPVEFIIVGFVAQASPAARERAVRDASYVAAHEAGHVTHLLALGRLGFGASVLPGPGSAWHNQPNPDRVKPAAAAVPRASLPTPRRAPTTRSHPLMP